MVQGLIVYLRVSLTQPIMCGLHLEVEFLFHPGKSCLLNDLSEVHLCVLTCVCISAKF